MIAPPVVETVRADTVAPPKVAAPLFVVTLREVSGVAPPIAPVRFAAAPPLVRVTPRAKAPFKVDAISTAPPASSVPAPVSRIGPV